MFKHNGQWKEFGVQGVDTTYFPFWLFCIVWAVIAYGTIRLIYSDKDVSIVKSAAAMASLTTRIQDSTISASIPPLPNVSLSSGPAEPIATEEAAPGYYKLDKSLMKRKGVPRYIYVGEEKPSDLEED
jgi:hypothetical protein